MFHLERLAPGNKPGRGIGTRAGHGHGARIARRMNQTRKAYRARFAAEMAELELLIAIVAARVKARTATPASSCGPEHDAGCPSPRCCASFLPRIGSLD